MQTSEHPDASDSSKALTPTPPAACTNACTSEGENANYNLLDSRAGEATEDGNKGPSDLLAVIAAALCALSPADRARLAKMLQGA
jgi:hypothetical protein